MSMMLRSSRIGLYWLYARYQSWASIRPDNHGSDVYLHNGLLWRCRTWNMCCMPSKLWCLFWFFEKVCCMRRWHLLIFRSILWGLLPTSLCWRSSQLDLCLSNRRSTLQSWMSLDLVQRYKFRLMYCYSDCILWDLQSNNRFMYSMRS